ncbi:MAG: hypothetical protein H6604_07245 [Flavobacteriales bacterium]|nr:hypothetical protein [Flavobacteriales bacterium]
MHTVTIDIINENALNLLKDLELLKLIHLRKNKSKEKVKTNWLNFKGTMSKQPLNDINQQLDELRNEWE